MQHLFSSAQKYHCPAMRRSLDASTANFGFRVQPFAPLRLKIVRFFPTAPASRAPLVTFFKLEARSRALFSRAYVVAPFARVSTSLDSRAMERDSGSSDPWTSEEGCRLGYQNKTFCLRNDRVLPFSWLLTSIGRSGRTRDRRPSDRNSRVMHGSVSPSPVNSGLTKGL